MKLFGYKRVYIYYTTRNNVYTARPNDGWLYARLVIMNVVIINSDSI